MVILMTELLIVGPEILLIALANASGQVQLTLDGPGVSCIFSVGKG